MSRPRMSWPMLCPKPQSAPIRVALMLLLPMVSGVRAYAVETAFLIVVKGRPTQQAVLCSLGLLQPFMNRIQLFGARQS